MLSSKIKFFYLLQTLLIMVTLPNISLANDKNTYLQQLNEVGLKLYSAKLNKQTPLPQRKIINEIVNCKTNEFYNNTQTCDINALKESVKTEMGENFSEDTFNEFAIINAKEDSISDIVKKAKSAKPQSLEAQVYTKMATELITMIRDNGQYEDINIIGKEELSFFEDNNVHIDFFEDDTSMVPGKKNVTITSDAVEYQIEQQSKMEKVSLNESARLVVCENLMKAFPTFSTGKFRDRFQTNLKNYLQTALDYGVTPQTTCSVEADDDNDADKHMDVSIENILNNITGFQEQKAELLKIIHEQPLSNHSSQKLQSTKGLTYQGLPSASGSFIPCHSGQDFSEILNLCDISKSLEEFSIRIEKSRLKKQELTKRAQLFSKNKKNKKDKKSLVESSDIESNANIPTAKKGARCSIKWIQHHFDQVQEESFRNIAAQITFTEENGQSKTYFGYPIDIDDLLIEITSKKNQKANFYASPPKSPPDERELLSPQSQPESTNMYDGP